MREALSFVGGLGSVAREYGLDESVFLHEIVHWCKQNKSQGSNFHEGRWWTYNTLQGLAEMFPWWTVKQVRRVAESCRNKGALLTARYNEDPQNHTLWYSPSDELLAMYGMDWLEPDESKCPNGQIDLPKSADGNAQTGKSYNEQVITTGNIPPIIPPEGEMSEAPPVAEEASEFRRCAPSGATDRERTAAGARVPERADEKKICAWNEARFLKFWAFYRDTFCASDHSRAGGKLKAADAWDKLKPDDAMIWEMADYLRATMNTRQWKDGIGMAMASTFLNGIRLHKIDLDERPEAAPTETRRSAPVREEDEFL